MNAMNLKSRPLMQFILALGLVAAACSNADKGRATDAGASGPVPEEHDFCTLPASCQQISQACMPKDDGSKGPIHDCHLTGMYYAIAADCDKDLNSCLATCNAAPGFGDGSVEDLSAQCRDGGASTTTGTQTNTSTNTQTNTSSGTFPSSPLSSFASDGKSLNIELRTAPDQPIDVGPGSEGQLKITDASTGAPVDGLEIAVASWMPLMKHACSPQQVKVEAQGQGIYHLTQVSASMKGACEFKLTISGTVTDTAVTPTFDITK
jgi:hypothetical protein